MEYNSEAIVIERKSYLKPLLITLVIVVMIAGGFQGYVFYQKSNNIVVENNIVELESYGLDESAPTDVALSGEVYYSSPALNSIDDTLYSYSYNLETNTTELLSIYPMSNPVRIDEETLLVLAPVTQHSPLEAWQPHLYNQKTEEFTALPGAGGFHLQNLTLSPDQKSYSYSYLNQEVTYLEETDLPDWSVAVHSLAGTEVKTVVGLKNSVWLDDNNLLAIAKEGVVVYNLETDTKSTIFSKYENMSLYDELAVSNDGQSLIFTKPDSNFMSVVKLTKGETITAKEVGRVATVAVSYSAPRFSGDGLMYVVLSSRVVNLAPVEDGYTFDIERYLEFRALNALPTLKELPVSEGLDNQHAISSWLTN